VVSQLHPIFLYSATAHRIYHKHIYTPTRLNKNGRYYHCQHQQRDDDDDELRRRRAAKEDEKIFSINLHDDGGEETRHSRERVRGCGVRGRDGRVLRGDSPETNRGEIRSRERRRRVRLVRSAERSEIRGV